MFTPPQKKRSFFLGGDNFFWEDPLGSSDHPSIIVGHLKVVWDLPKNFVGPPAGLRRLTTAPKGFHCPKMIKNQGFWTKFGRERGGPILACSFSSQNLKYNVFWAQKILYDAPAPSGHTWTAQKRTISPKQAKIVKKSQTFTSKEMCFKCVQNVKFVFFFILRELKNKIGFQFYVVNFFLWTI